MLWIKALHIIFIVCWFAGLFYLPRLFVYHAMATDPVGIERFKIMERKLYYGIMTPGAVLTLLSGFWLLVYKGESHLYLGWFQAKIALVLLLVVFHLYCGKLYRAFKHNQNKYSHVFYRWLNEVPTILLIAIVVLTVVKPF